MKGSPGLALARHCRAGLGVSVTLAVMPALAALAAPAKARAHAPRKHSPVRYNRDIRPILAENCFTCHGTDHNKRMANLRLDDRAVAVTRGAIVPGRPEMSRLVTRIFAVEPARRMPPVATHKNLSSRQKEL